MTKSVTIVGAYPFDWPAIGFPTDEVWGFNSVWAGCPLAEFTRWFDLHDLDAMYPVESDHEMWDRNRRHLRELKDWGKMGKGFPTLYLFAPWSTMHGAETFPWEPLVERWGRIFGNSPSWLIAHAIEEGFTRIDIAGIQMNTWYEIAFERRSITYMIGAARALGIEVGAPSWVDEPYLYGVEQSDDIRWRLRRQVFHDEVKSFIEMWDYLTGATPTGLPGEAR